MSKNVFLKSVFIFSFFLYLSQFPKSWAEEFAIKKIYSSVAIKSSPELGEITTAKIGDLLYVETAIPNQLTLTLIEELSIPGKENFIFPIATQFSEYLFQDEKVFCHIQRSESPDTNIPKGFHCLWDLKGDRTIDFYKFKEFGKSPFGNKIILDTVKYLNSPQFEANDPGDDILVPENSKYFFLHSIKREKIRLAFQEVSFRPGTVVISTDQTKNNSELFKVPYKLVSIKFKGEEVSYIIDGLEITILKLDGENITYKIDKPFKSWAKIKETGYEFVTTYSDVKKAIKKK